VLLQKETTAKQHLTQYDQPHWAPKRASRLSVQPVEATPRDWRSVCP